MRRWWRRLSPWLLVGFGLLVGVVLTIAVVRLRAGWLDHIGDALTPIALLVAVASVLLQSNELGLQRQELGMQRREMKRQADELGKSSRSQELYASAARLQSAIVATEALREFEDDLIGIVRHLRTVTRRLELQIGGDGDAIDAAELHDQLELQALPRVPRYCSVEVHEAAKEAHSSVRLARQAVIDACAFCAEGHGLPNLEPVKVALYKVAPVMFTFTVTAGSWFRLLVAPDERDEEAPTP